MTVRRSAVRRAFANIPFGQLHYAEAGAGEPVVLLHQTPRSWDEFRDVLPILSERYRAIAPDSLGFGDSVAPAGAATIERYAEGVLALLDELEIESAALVGHHTGGVVAIELAAAWPDRVWALVLSSTPFVDGAFRRERAGRSPLGRVEPSDDGSHLSALWQQRQPFYPAGRPDLLSRFVLDALKAGTHAEEGHRAVASYEMERRIGQVRAPALLIGAPADPFAYPQLPRLAGAMSGARTIEVPGGMIPLPDQRPQEFAGAVLSFLESIERRRPNGADA